MKFRAGWSREGRGRPDETHQHTHRQRYRRKSMNVTRTQAQVTHQAPTVNLSKAVILHGSIKVRCSGAVIRQSQETRWRRNYSIRTQFACMERSWRCLRGWSVTTLDRIRLWHTLLSPVTDHLKQTLPLHKVFQRTFFIRRQTALVVHEICSPSSPLDGTIYLFRNQTWVIFFYKRDKRNSICCVCLPQDTTSKLWVI